MTLATKPLQLETEDDLALADRLRAAREGIVAELRSRIVGQDDVALAERLRTARDAIMSELRHVIVGQEEVIEQALVALFSGGNCLIVGVPGLAKTLLVSTLAQVLDLTFSRIQFTPDLMPSDITGTDIIQVDTATGQRQMTFSPGPIFANVVLADEINRTPPKTQAALLEVMEERQVSVDRTARPLPEIGRAHV